MRAETGALPAAQHVTVETVRPDGSRQVFDFTSQGDFLKSLDEIPEPHAFTAKLQLRHGSD
jgi:nickel/cobalt exporter